MTLYKEKILGMPSNTFMKLLDGSCINYTEIYSNSGLADTKYVYVQCTEEDLTYRFILGTKIYNNTVLSVDTFACNSSTIEEAMYNDVDHFAHIGSNYNLSIQ